MQSMIRAGAIALALSATTLACFAAPTQATATLETVTVTPTPDAVEDVGFGVTVSGQAASSDRVLYATVKPNGVAACGATPGTDAGEDIVVYASATDAYSKAATVEAGEPGAYQICAWLTTTASTPVVIASNSTIVGVRGAIASINPSGRKRIRTGRGAKITFTGSSELERQLFASVRRRNRPGTCGGASSLAGGRPLVTYRSVQGQVRVRAKIDGTYLHRRGRYQVCAWVQEGEDDLAPEAVGSFNFKVRPRRRN